MAEKDWRMPAMCESCPFQKSGPGLRQRRALRPERWREILRGLRTNRHFFCHKTADHDESDETYEGNYIPTGKEKYCAGALAYEDKLGISTNYRRVCESLDSFAVMRKAKAQAGL